MKSFGSEKTTTMRAKNVTTGLDTEQLDRAPAAIRPFHVNVPEKALVL